MLDRDSGRRFGRGFAADFVFWKMGERVAAWLNRLRKKSG
jgi:hypothetical protein